MNKVCIAVLLLFSIQDINGMTINYKQKLKSDHKNTRFGWRIGISKDLLLVADPADNHNIGSITMFHINDTNVQTRGDKMASLDKDKKHVFGYDVAANDHYIVVPVCHSIKSTKISVRHVSAPHALVQIIDVPLRCPPFSLVISEDNSIAIAGHHMNKNGAVIVYTFNNSRWSLSQELDFSTWCYGLSVSMTPGHMAVGQPCFASEEGVVHMYARGNGKWVLKANLNDIDIPYSYFGHSLDIHQDRMVVTAGGVGSVYVYKYDSSLRTWKKEDVIKRNDWFGQKLQNLKVAINGDLIAITTDIIGLAFIYKKNKNNKWKEKALLRAIDSNNQSQPIANRGYPFVEQIAHRARERRVSTGLEIAGKLVFNSRLQYNGGYEGAVYVHDISQLFSTSDDNEDDDQLKNEHHDSVWRRWAHAISYVSKIWRY